MKSANEYINVTLTPDCVICGKSISIKSYIKSGRKRKYCSKKCSILGRTVSAMARCGKECLLCGKYFKAKSVEKSKYCSRECSIADNKARSRNCKNCQSLFSPIRWQSSKGRFISDRANDRRFCSDYCRRVCLLSNRHKDCVNCGSKFTPVRLESCSGMYIPYDIPTTCSKECSKMAYPISEERKFKLSLMMSGESHPNWIGGGHRYSYRGSGWRAIAEMVREKSGRVCEKCGKSEVDNGRRLDINHIVPFNQIANKKNPNKLSNLQALCRSCHAKADWEWRRKNPVQFLLNIM